MSPYLVSSVSKLLVRANDFNLNHYLHACTKRKVGLCASVVNSAFSSKLMRRFGEVVVDGLLFGLVAGEAEEDHVVVNFGL